VEIEFDPAKDARPSAAMAPMAFGAVVLANRIGEVEDARRDYGETRIKAFGLVEGVLFACIYTMRGEVFRILSVHRVREKEARRWLEAR
jgi:uncharacterized DUF497 family protein